ncbi:MAG: DUF2254 family protein [Anaerolineales bacterium]|nr:DUF2254 family protein [Anaerolineales bacterium]
MLSSLSIGWRFARNVLLLALALLGGLIFLLAWELWRGGYSLSALVVFDLEEARHLHSLLSRNLNQLLAVVFTSVAIAVPLTANLYSLKFLEFFIKDPVNAAVLLLVVCANLVGTWAGVALKDDFLPSFLLVATLALTVICYALLFPYLYYVFRFLHPSTLLERLEAEVYAHWRGAQRSPARLASHRLHCAGDIEHIASIAIRAIDRADRSTAIESVLKLEAIARAYWQIKPQLPSSWFEADANAFLGFSSRAIAEFTAKGIWLEMQLFGQVRQVLSAAIPRVHDVTTAIARSTRKLGQERAALADEAVRNLIVEYFNTFLRLAIVRQDTRSAFIILDQYRTWVEGLNSDHPELVNEIALYFANYGRVARENKLRFIAEAVARDLGVLVQQAWRDNAPNRQALLDLFLSYDRGARKPLEGVKKAQAILAGYLLLLGQTEPVALIRREFQNLPPAFLQTIRDDLLYLQREKYWEIGERRGNVDDVPADQREKLREFLDSVAAPEAVA